MKPIILAALACAAIIATTPAAEAARCPQGSIYRPTQGVCISKASALRAGIYRPRSIKAKPQKRAPAKRTTRSEYASPYPPPSPPWKQRVTIIESRPAWLDDVDLFDNLHAQAWSLNPDQNSRRYAR